MKHGYYETSYDVKHIENIAKRKFALSVIMYLALVLMTVAGALMIILYGKYIPVFIGGSVLIVISILLTVKKIKRFDITTLRASIGKISDIDVQIRTHRQIAGGIGLHSRQYDTYKKETTSVGVYIDEGDKVTPYYIHNASKKQVEYYRNNSSVIHIFATRFPIKINEESEEWFCSVCKTKNRGSDRACVSCRCHKNNEWLCPICGGFNESGEIHCSSCKARIMKKTNTAEQKLC